jgi:hypothetical protein
MGVRTVMIAVVAVASSLMLLASSPAFAGTRTNNVFDAGFIPLHVIKMGQGSKVQWYFDSENQQEHVVSSFFFASPNQGPATLFTQQFTGAGTYIIADTPSGDMMQVQVRAVATPASGACDTTFTVQGGVPVEHGKALIYTYGVMVPGGSWQDVARDTPDLTASYSPGAGCSAGTYKFRVRTELARHPGQHSDYSRVVLVSVAAP